MKKRVLFVCLGNICRSPAAEAVFGKMVLDRGYGDFFDIDSAGTGAWHAGEPADKRMQQHAGKRNYKLTSIARKFDPARDFDRFDYIIGMDDENTAALRELSRNREDRNKIFKMTRFCRIYHYNEVPDPYYGGEEGFELVLDLLEDACEGLTNQLIEEIR